MRPLNVSAILALVVALGVQATPLKLDYNTQGTATFTPLRSQEYSYNYGFHQHNDPYTIGPNNWDVWLTPDPPEYLRGASVNFANLMGATFKTSDGWSYQSAANELSDNSLIVRIYAARSGSDLAGAEFLVEYAPGFQDPLLDVHWIQVITDNHAVGAAHGTPENAVDYRYAGSPYYDHGGVATSTWFYDFPKREWDAAHTWTAELYLVTGPPVIEQPDGKYRPTPGAVTVLGGIKWGWENACLGGGARAAGGGGGTDGGNMVCADDVSTPEAGSLVYLLSGLSLLWARGALRRARSSIAFH
ncbi:MAG: hypothetical protein HY820_44830 [Acidobacteria bacterium]|nr:hypothetical protein [Acidobacteriota bacterium]